MEYLWRMGSASRRTLQRTFAVSSGSLKRASGGEAGMFTSMGVSPRRQATAGVDRGNLIVMPTGCEVTPLGLAVTDLVKLTRV